MLLTLRHHRVMNTTKRRKNLWALPNGVFEQDYANPKDANELNLQLEFGPQVQKVVNISLHLETLVWCRRYIYR